MLVVFFPKFKPPPVGSLSVNIVEGEKNNTHNNSTPTNNQNASKAPEKSNSVSISNSNRTSSSKSTPTQAKSRSPAQSRGVPNISIPKLGSTSSKVPPIGLNLGGLKKDSDEDGSSEESSSGEDSE